MLRRLVCVTVFALLAARGAQACSAMSWTPETLLENEAVSSANGRFKAVVRWYEGIPDFSSRLAGEVFSEDRPAPLPSVTVAFYGSQRLAEIPIERSRADEVFVSDSGRYLVVLAQLSGGGCSGHSTAEDPFVTIYTAEGTLVGSLTVGDFLGSWDLWSVVSDHRHNVEYELRHESDTREVFVVKIQTSATDWAERRIDVTTAALLDPKTDIFPRPRVYATPVDVPPRDFLPPPAGCAAAFDDPDLVRLQSRHLYSRATFGPVPPFPELMFKARIRGPVIVDVVVSEEGEVLCTRTSSLPFGGSQAASGAALRWKFTPMTIGAHPVRFAGELVFHFEDLDEETWRDRMRYAPPTEE